MKLNFTYEGKKMGTLKKSREGIFPMGEGYTVRGTKKFINSLIVQGRMKDLAEIIKALPIDVLETHVRTSKVKKLTNGKGKQKL